MRIDWRGFAPMLASLAAGVTLALTGHEELAHLCIGAALGALTPQAFRGRA
jgi:hypothetical protein